MTIQDVIAEASVRGVTGLPAASRLTDVRVWPVGDQWVAETGTVPNNTVVGDGMYTSKEEAIEAALKAIQEGRLSLVKTLPTDLAATAGVWADPTVNVWDR